MIPWFGFAFENFFTNNALYFADRMGFADKVESYGPYYKKSEGVQVDLIYYRSDKTLSVCEMKFQNDPVSTEVIPEFKNKIRKISLERNFSAQKILIAPNGASEALIKADYFDLIVTAKELFR